MTYTLGQVKVGLELLKYPASLHNEMLRQVDELGYEDKIGRGPGAPEGAREYLLEQLPGLERLTRHVYGTLFGAGLVDELGATRINEVSATLALELLNQGEIAYVEAK